MDGTHFVHHPMTKHIKSSMTQLIGQPLSIDSTFQFNLTDKDNIRYNPELEPYGAIGDAGWYCMKAAVQYLSPTLEIISVESFLRRDDETKAVISGSGIIAFNDNSTCTWNCGFDSDAVIMDLRISGTAGVIKVNDFVSQHLKDHSANYDYLQRRKISNVKVPALKSERTLMFENFASMIGNSELMTASIHNSERTQTWLDAIWISALKNESIKQERI